MLWLLRKFKWYRKYKGGTWMLITTDITYGAFWVDETFRPCCGTIVLKVEHYEKSDKGE